MSIQVTNLSSGEVLTYSLPLLVGEVTPPLTQGHIKVTCFTEKRIRLWPICNGQFKILVPLKKGENKIELHFFDETVDFVLFYRVPLIRKFVRPIYIKPHDDDGLFQGPDGEDTSVESATKRIALAAKLIQSFTAEKLHEHGLGRKTFVLESDLYPKGPACQVFTSKMTLKRARETPGGDLWMSFARELMSSKSFREKENVKWYSFMSFTHYCPPESVVPKSHSEVIRFTQGHTALGGGGLALFGTGNLHTWASCIEEFVSRFTDTRKIDRSKLMDDSAYRQYHWANYSTGLGASLHELGHTFDLAHTPTGIMSRGFDDIYRTFLAQHMAVSRESSSRESSRLASPIPYSPKESPVHRPRRKESIQDQKSGSGSRSSSPKPCPLSRPPQARSGVSMMPSVIQIETAFRRVAMENTQTLTVHNYDGSQTKKTITRNRDGTETISEVTTFADGKQIAREIIKHVASGKTRTTMSMATNVDRSGTEKSPRAAAQSPQTSASKWHDISSAATQVKVQVPSTSQATPAFDSMKLPKSPGEEGAVSSDSSLSFQQVKYKDGGAHWYRSSAVMLAFHKWFNEPKKGDPRKPPQVENGVVRASGDRGLRLIELRSLPEGVVFHHWEFLQDHPPTAFVLRQSEIMHLSHNANQITVVAEDDYGNIIKKKVVLADLDKEAVEEKKSVLSGAEVAEELSREKSETNKSEEGLTPQDGTKAAVGEREVLEKQQSTTASGKGDREQKRIERSVCSVKNSAHKDSASSNDASDLSSRCEAEKANHEHSSCNQDSTSKPGVLSVEIPPHTGPIQSPNVAAKGTDESLPPRGNPPTGSFSEQQDCSCPAKTLQSEFRTVQDANQNLALSDQRLSKADPSTTAGANCANSTTGQHSTPGTEHFTKQESSDNSTGLSTTVVSSSTEQAVSCKRFSAQDDEYQAASELNGVKEDEMTASALSADFRALAVTDKEVLDIEEGETVAGEVKQTVNGIAASASSEEDVMQSSKESGSDECAENDADIFSKNDQHNIALQQTVESNQEKGGEMNRSFLLENGNVDL